MAYWYLYLRLKNIVEGESGQSLTEYALLFSLVVVVGAMAVPTFGEAVLALYLKTQLNLL